MSDVAEQLLRRHRLTVGDYQRMGEAGILDEDARVELIEGEIIEMTPIGSRHAGTVDQLAFSLGAAVGRSAIVSVQSPLVLGERSEPQPDVKLLRPRRDFYKSAHPGSDDVLLLIEVADTSLEYDRRIKIPLYARHGVPEVWLVDLLGAALTVFRSPREEGYADVSTPPSLDGLSPESLPSVRLELSDLF